MATILASNDNDLQTVNQRITDASGVPGILNPDNIKENSINIIDDTSGVLRLVFSPATSCWYVQHFWGDKTSWLPLLKAMNTELINRGEGNTPVRWTKTISNPFLVTFLKKLAIRTVTDTDAGQSMFEITAAEATPILAKY